VAIAGDEFMARAPTKFKQRDLMRALRATLAAGLQVREIKVDQQGQITLVPEQVPAPLDALPENSSEWDAAIK
jgi:hypothetical protein